MDHPRPRKQVPLQQAVKTVPGHLPLAVATCQPLLPAFKDPSAKPRQCIRIAGDPIVCLMAPELLPQRGLVLLERSVLIPPIPEGNPA